MIHIAFRNTTLPQKAQKNNERDLRAFFINL